MVAHLDAADGASGADNGEYDRRCDKEMLDRRRVRDNVRIHHNVGRRDMRT